MHWADNSKKFARIAKFHLTENFKVVIPTTLYELINLDMHFIFGKIPIPKVRYSGFTLRYTIVEPSKFIFAFTNSRSTPHYTAR
jgi:hypothetical protein